MLAFRTVEIESSLSEMQLVCDRRNRPVGLTAEFHVALCHTRISDAEIHAIIAEFQVALGRVVVSLDESCDSSAVHM